MPPRRGPTLHPASSLDVGLHGPIRATRPHVCYSCPFPSLAEPPTTDTGRFRPGGVRPMDGAAVRSPWRGGVLDGFCLYP